jgi:hypothetical protein
MYSDQLGNYQFQIQGINTPLFLVSVKGKMAISTFYSFEVIFLASNVNEEFFNGNPNLVHGTPVSFFQSTASIVLPIKDANGNAVSITGVINECVQSDQYFISTDWQNEISPVSGPIIYSQYTVTLVPQAQILLGSVNTQVFVSATLVEIIEQVLNQDFVNFHFSLGELPDTGFPNNQLTTTRYPFIFQYQETDANFLMRLMERAGLIFYFDFSQAAENTYDSGFSMPQEVLMITTQTKASEKGDINSGLVANPIVDRLAYYCLQINGGTAPNVSTSVTDGGLFWSAQVKTKCMPESITYWSYNYNQALSINYPNLSPLPAPTPTGPQITSAVIKNTPNSPSGFNPIQVVEGGPVSASAAPTSFNPLNNQQQNIWTNLELQPALVQSYATLIASIYTWQSAVYTFYTSGAYSILPGYTHYLDFTDNNIFGKRWLNASGRYTVISVDYDISLWQSTFSLLNFQPAGYMADHAECRVNAIPGNINYFAPIQTPKPKISGVIPAIVGGDKGTAYTQLDDNGCYVIYIPIASYLENSPLQIKGVVKAENNASATQGTNFPLVQDAQILLAFQDGDPDCPIIVGTVSTTANPALVTAKNQDTCVQYFATQGSPDTNNTTPPTPPLPQNSTVTSLTINNQRPINWNFGNLINTYKGAKGEQAATFTYPDGSQLTYTTAQISQYLQSDFDTFNAGNTNNVTIGNTANLYNGKNCTETLGDMITITKGDNKNYNYGKDYNETWSSSTTICHENSSTITYGDDSTTTHGSYINVSYGGMIDTSHGDMKSTSYGDMWDTSYGNSYSETYGDSVTYCYGTDIYYKHGNSSNYIYGSQFNLNVGPMFNLMIAPQMNITFGVDTRITMSAAIDINLLRLETSAASIISGATQLANFATIMRNCGVSTVNTALYTVQAGLILLD